MTSAFAKIAVGLEDAIAFVDGEVDPGMVAPVDVRALRDATKMTQDAFAKTYRFPVGTVRDREQKRRQPDTRSATLLKMIQADPEGVQAIIAKLRGACTVPLTPSPN